MTDSLSADAPVLLGSAAALAFLHTLVGIDHSLPFILLGRVRRWSLRRTLAVTGVCGLGHVASSVLIGGIGIALGLALDRLTWVESARGELAAALLIGFGLASACGALWRYRFRGRTHSHLHAHADGTVHDHPHDHRGEHLHPHGIGRGLTPWALFVIFAFGPCESLIPLMVVPAVSRAWLVLAVLVLLFGLVTIGTMMLTVTAGYLGLRLDRLHVLEPHAEVVAGLVIAASGAAVLWLGI